MRLWLLLLIASTSVLAHYHCDKAEDKADHLSRQIRERGSCKTIDFKVAVQSCDRLEHDTYQDIEYVTFSFKVKKSRSYCGTSNTVSEGSKRKIKRLVKNLMAFCEDLDLRAQLDKKKQVVHCLPQSY